MRLLVLPRDANPYQELLYGEMRRLGVQITYLADLTPSRTLNLLLLPLETTVHRIAGVRLIHLHWVFIFALPGMRRFRILQRIAYVWYLFWLRVCRMLGMRLVWTAHNVLPHTPVFADDVSARRALVAASDLVLAHSPSALAELATFGVMIHRSAIIPHGPIAPTRSVAPPEASSTDGGPRRFLFFGRVQEYKGVDDLLAAFSAMPDGIAAHLTVAGQCDDPRLGSRLHTLAETAGARVVLRLQHVPEEEVELLFAAAEVVVLPFRRVTTSGSTMFALSRGKPLIVPDLPGLADLPAKAVLRYGRGVPALTAALAHLALADSEILSEMSATARGYAARTTWREIAERTTAEMVSLLGDAPVADLYGRTVRAP